MTSLSRRVGILVPILLLVAAGFAVAPSTVHAAQSKNAPLSLDDQTPLHEPNPLHDAQVALIRLPLAARRRARRPCSRPRSSCRSSARSSCSWSAPASRARSALSAPPISFAIGRKL